jgi:autotransporter-associated beta strand protein
MKTPTVRDSHDTISRKQSHNPIIEGSITTLMRGLATLVLVAPLVNHSALASTILWSSAGGSAWLTGTNWTGSAVPTGTDIAQFGVNPTGTAGTVGINFNSTTNAGTQSNGSRIEDVGAIEVASTRISKDITIGNSATTAGATGTLRLKGTTVNTVSNVVLRNNASGGNLILQPTNAGGTNPAMSVSLGNAIDNVVVIDNTGGITISAVVKDDTTPAHLTLTGSGTGIFTLSGANTYSGGTTIGTGQLRATNITGSATGTGAVLVGNNTGVAVLSGTGLLSGLVTTASTGANVAHIAPGNNSGITNFGGTGTLQLNGGLTIGAGSVLDWDIASTLGGTSDLITLNNTALTLGTAFTINYNELTPGLLATSGTYTLISGVSNAVDLTGITITSTGLTAGSQTYIPTYSFSSGTLRVSFSSFSAPTPNYFDTNGSTAGIGINGGTAVWDNLTTNWNPVSTGDGTAKAYQSAQTVYFGASGGGTAGTVTVDAGGVTINNGIQFEVTGYTLNGGTITVAGVNTLAVPGAGDSATINAKLSGAVGITKTGNGALTLGGANDFTGTVSISGGTLTIADDSNLGATANSIAFSGNGALKAGAGIASTRNISITAAGGGGRIDTNGFDMQTSGTTSISDAFTKAGAGNLSLNGTVSFVAGTGASLNITGGSLTLGQLSGPVTMIAGASLNGNLVLTNGIRLNLNGTYSGTGQIQVQKTFASLANTGTGVTVTIGTNISLNSSNVALPFATNLGPVSNGTMTINGVISGNSDLNIAGGGASGGTGTLTLNSQNSYTGATTVNSGTAMVVKLGIDNALPVGTSLGFNTLAGATGGTIDLNGHNQTVASLFYAGTATTATASNFKITNSGGVDATFTVNGATTPAFSFAGVLSDGATNKLLLAKSGNGTLTLTGANTYSGGTSVGGGILNVTTDGALGSLSGAVTIANGATLQAGGSFNTNRAITLGVGGGTIDTNGYLVTLGAGTVAGTSLTKAGNGTLTLSGTNTYSAGTYVTGGVLNVNSDGALGAAGGSVTISGGAMLQAGGSFSTSRAIILGIGGGVIDTNGNSLTLGASTVSGTSLLKTGDGTLALSGTNTYSGGTTIEGGVLSVSGRGALGAAGRPLALSSDATLKAAGLLTITDRTLTLSGGGGKIDTNGQDVTFAAGSTITGDDGNVLEITGAGTATLAGTQTYSILTTSGSSITTIKSALGTGTSTLNANATTNIETSQVLAGLNIGPGAVVTFEDEPVIASFASGAGPLPLSAVPEPGAMSLLIVGALCLSRRRKKLNA